MWQFALASGHMPFCEESNIKEVIAFSACEYMGNVLKSVFVLVSGLIFPVLFWFYLDFKVVLSMMAHLTPVLLMSSGPLVIYAELLAVSQNSGFGCWYWLFVLSPLVLSSLFRNWLCWNLHPFLFVLLVLHLFLDWRVEHGVLFW